MAKGNGTRIYVVHEGGQPVALIRAASQAQAIRHVVGDKFEAIVADADHVYTLATQGMKVQEARNDAAG